MKKSLCCTLLLLLSACKNDQTQLAENITSMLAKQPTQLDLRTVAGPDWTRVCFLGPYSDNKIARMTLGFDWDLDAKTDLKMSDSINVLVFVQDKTVVNYSAYPRQNSDFSNLTGQCFERQHALLKKADAKSSWQPAS